MRRSSAASERLAALEIFLTDYSTPLMKQLGRVLNCPDGIDLV
jgi:hypothetical protein